MKVGLRDLIEFAFLPVLSAGVFVLWDVNKNINSLNVQVSVLIERSSSYKEEIDSLKRRLDRIEEKQSVQSGTRKTKGE